MKAGSRLSILAILLALPSAMPAADAAPSSGEALTVLLFHPDDGVDPLGFPYQESDAFTVRYGTLVADKGRFDFPFFLADGVLPIESIPDPSKPYASAAASYRASIEQRRAEQAPVALDLGSRVAGSQLLASVTVRPASSFPDEDLHLWVAVAEDHVHYQPPPGLTNGVTDHRFTVRALADLGRLDLSTAGAAANASRTFLLDEGWAKDRLSVAAWVQQGAASSPSPRFQAREVVQATHAEAGASVQQARKGVLAEMLSATWCDPCLYGDKAVEDLAVSYGAAEPGDAASRARYLQWDTGALLPVVAAVALGGGLVALGARSRGKA